MWFLVRPAESSLWHLSCAVCNSSKVAFVFATSKLLDVKIIIMVKTRGKWFIAVEIYKKERVIISTSLQPTACSKFLSVLSLKKTRVGTGWYWIVIIYKPSGVKDVNFTALEKQMNKVRVLLIKNGVLFQFLKNPWNYLLIKHENTRAPKYLIVLFRELTDWKMYFHFIKASAICVCYSTVFWFFSQFSAQPHS